MARINIEDTLWADQRFQDLLIKVGNRHKAKGMILELWMLAQKYWLASKGAGIPKTAWVEVDMPTELIECKLARENGDFIYAIGSKDQFQWLEQRSNAGRENKGKSNERRKTKGNGRKRARSSSSSSSSSSDSNTNTENAVFDFESIWTGYPKSGRIGKQKGFEKLKASIKTPEEFESLKQALANYLATDRVKNGYVKDFFRWAAQWEDFAADGIGKSDIGRIRGIEEILADEEAKRVAR